MIRARQAAAALFLTNGALFANLAPRLPEFKEQLGLDASGYGLLVAAWPAGALAAGLGAGWLIRRFGSGTVAVFGTILTGLAILGAALAAPSVALVAAAFALGGAMDAITDVAQNAQGLVVQRRIGRSIINSFHALWSVGAVLGGLMAAAALNLPLAVHFAGSWLLFSALALAVWRFCLPDERVRRKVVGAPTVRIPVSARTIITITALVLIAVAAVAVEDAGNSWATLYLSSLGAPGPLAAAGFIVLVGAQFIGRLLGDGMVERVGQRAVAQGGTLLLTVGMGLALAFPSIPGSLAGFAAAGFGVATLVPAAMAQADQLPGLAPGTGLSVVSWLMRVGTLLSPPLVGLLAQHYSLRAGLLLVPLLGVIVLLCSPVLRARRSRVR